MARMKDRNHPPPYGWQYHQTQTNWDAPGNLPFDGVVAAVVNHRKGNPFVCQQHNLSIDPVSVANEVDEYNAARCMAHEGWSVFVGDTSPSPKTWAFPATMNPLKRFAKDAAGGVKRTAAGLALILDWVGEGLKPVDHDLAEKRALTCVNCPHNADPNWFSKLTAEVADQVKKLLEVKNDLKITTSVDDRLNFCDICLCTLSLKCHSPIDLILKKTEESVLKQHAEVVMADGKRCWVTEEASQLK